MFIFCSVRRLRHHLSNHFHLIYIRSTYARCHVFGAPNGGHLRGNVNAPAKEGNRNVIHRRQRLAARYRFVCLTRNTRGDVVLTVSAKAFLVFLSIGFCLRHDRQLRSVHRVRGVTLGTSTFFYRSILRCIQGSVKRIFLHRRLFLITRLGSTFNRFTRNVFVRLWPRILRVLPSVNFATILTRNVLSLTAGTFKRRIITMRIAFVIAINVSTYRLNGCVLTGGQFVNKGSSTQMKLRRATCIIRTTFIGINGNVRIIFRSDLRANGQDVTNTFTRTIGNDVRSLTATGCNNGRVTRNGIVIVINVRIGVNVQVTFRRLTRRLSSLRQIRCTRHIERRVTTSVNLLRNIRRARRVFQEVFRTITPIFRVSVRCRVLLINMVRCKRGVLSVLFKDLLRLMNTVLRQTFTRRVSSATANHVCPIRQHITVCGTGRFCS